MIDLRLGDCLEVMKAMPDNSVDSIVTDPPYGLSFMGKSWDYQVPSSDVWREALRVVKPGGHLLSFGGTRTYHRLVIEIEEAGFEVRDMIQWIYGSGFPKSTDVSKRIDKEAGAEREVVGPAKRSGLNSRAFQSENKTTAGQHFESAPSTPDAKQWQGWGTALKPANEPICVARKPLEKGLTVAANVLKYGTGALNIDGSRIALTEGEDLSRPVLQTQSWKNTSTAGVGSVNDNWKQGRWPANVLLDEEAAAALDEQSGALKSGAGNTRKNPHKTNAMSGCLALTGDEEISYGDSGGASRFFYVAKASKRERGSENIHPTVKPLKLMSYLINLVTPPNGTVLDPFMGSGTTGLAAKNLGRSFIGIEKDPGYFEIAKKRIEQNNAEASA